MRTLSQAELLDLWERGHALHPIDRGLLAIHAAFPETQGESVADWPLGQRNRALAQWRCASFGARLRGWTACRQCAQALEFELDAHAITQTPVATGAQAVESGGAAFRLPTSRDLARIAAIDDADEAARRLVEQCWLDEGGTPGAWSDAQVEAIGEALARADPLAEIVLDFDCPACGESFQESLDLAAFVWAEMEAQARRLLWEIHTLASAYGWSEAAILALNASRRARYLEMVRT